MTAVWIWVGAALAYLLFRAWYDNWRGPLTAAEVDAVIVLRRDDHRRKPGSRERE